jgi:hypothetical protein
MPSYEAAAGNVARPGVTPNKRLKLAAPVVCGKLSFVTIPARRRSLSATR